MAFSLLDSLAADGQLNQPQIVTFREPVAGLRRHRLDQSSPLGLYVAGNA